MSHATLMETLNLGVMRYDLPLKSHRLAECPPRWWALKILEITLLWFDTSQERIVSAWDTKVLRVLLLYLPHLQSVTWDYSGTKKCLSHDYSSHPSHVLRACEHHAQEASGD